MFRDLFGRAVSKYQRDGLLALLSAGAMEAVFVPYFHRFVLPQLRERILTGDDIYERCEAADTLWTYEGPTVAQGPPENHPAFDPVLSRNHAGYSTRPESVFELRNVTIFGPSGVVSDADGSFIFLMNSRENFERNLLYGGTQLYREAIDSRFHSLYPEFGRSQQFDVAASLVTHVGQHYGHWLLEYLPQVMQLFTYEEQTGREPLILVNQNSPAWMSDSLHLLGISDDRIVEWNNNYADINRFVQTFPNTVGTTPETTVMSPTAYRWLREQLVDAVSDTDTTERRRFYISRQGVDTRFVSNFEDIEPILENYNIDIVRPETMSFEDQIRLFSRGSLFVGPRGSGMHNVLFAKDASVVEITTPKWRLQAQQLLCNGLGHQYTHVTGSAYDESPQTTKEFRKSAFKVDPDELSNVLERVLVATPQ